MINAAQNHLYKPGYGSGMTRGALLQHEWATQWDSVTSERRSEIMYPTMLRPHLARTRTATARA